MYTADNLLPVLPIKYLINEDGETITTFKLATNKKPSILHLRFLFCPRVVQKSTGHVGTNALNMRQQPQNGFCGIFVGIPQHQKQYLFYVPHKHKIISSYDVIFYESFKYFEAKTTTISRSNGYVTGSVVHTI